MTFSLFPDAILYNNIHIEYLYSLKFRVPVHYSRSILLSGIVIVNNGSHLERQNSSLLVLLMCNSLEVAVIRITFERNRYTDVNCSNLLFSCTGCSMIINSSHSFSSWVSQSVCNNKYSCLEVKSGVLITTAKRCLTWRQAYISPARPPARLPAVINTAFYSGN